MTNRKDQKSLGSLQKQPEGLLHVQALCGAPRAGDGEARVRDEGAPVPHVRHHTPGARGRGHLAEVQDERLGDDGNSDHPPNPRTDSSTMTSRGKASFNRRTQQTSKITQYYKFRGKNK